MYDVVFFVIYECCVCLFMQIKRMYDKSTYASTAKFNHNCMASNAWVRDRVIDILRNEPTKGAG
jgi:hypothetical protein